MLAYSTEQSLAKQTHQSKANLKALISFHCSFLRPPTRVETKTRPCQIAVNDGGEFSIAHPDVASHARVSVAFFLIVLADFGRPIPNAVGPLIIEFR